MCKDTIQPVRYLKGFYYDLKIRKKKKKTREIAGHGKDGAIILKVLGPAISTSHEKCYKCKFSHSTPEVLTL
jgi:hypothetical protein